MPSRHRSAWRRRRLSRVAIPLAIPVALAVVVGVIIAVAGAATERQRHVPGGNASTPGGGGGSNRSVPRGRHGHRQDGAGM